MTGGEPMLYPNFVSLAGLLTRGHYISLSTNLSTANAYEFADTVAGNRVISIRANIHILEREKIKDGVKEYFANFIIFRTAASISGLCMSLIRLCLSEWNGISNFSAKKASGKSR